MNPPRAHRRSRRPAARRALATTLALALALAAMPARPQSVSGSQTPVTVNFVNAEVEAVTRAFAAMLGRPILVDARVKGQITVYSEQPQTVAQAWQSYLLALRGMGAAVVESSGLLKVVPEADAKQQTGTVLIGGQRVRGDQVVTQIFPLNYENPNNLMQVLRPLISANNTINVSPQSQALVITDYADNLQRIGRIIAALDQPAASDLEVVPLQHAVAADLAPVVQRLAEGGTVSGPQAGTAAASATTVLADSRSNSLIVRASNPARLALVKSTIAQLDKPSAGLGPSGGLWVVHLKNADAVKLATVLRSAFGQTGTGGGTSGSGTGTGAGYTGGLSGTGTTQRNLQQTSTGTTTGAGSSAATSPVTPSGDVTTGGFIQADPSTNSLIITAPEPLYRQVRAMIDQLDERRAQVYIEALIVEISGDNAADIGLQWQGLSGSDGDKYGVFAGTNFSSTTGAGNIVDLTIAGISGAVTANPLTAGLNIGLLKNYGGTYALAAIARLLQSQTKTNVISTPNQITLDNEEAKIVVGENVPFITGQYTNTGTGTTTSPFQTIERQDVGLTLRVRPQIGESGSVRMTIYLEDSAVLQSAVAGTTNAGPSTSKRSIESQVVVEDGQIIVLGGLIKDSYIETRNKVPLLGDIPWLGALFRSESRTKERTNLMVFLRPVVLRDADSTTRFSLDRYDQIRARQLEAQPSPSIALPNGPTPSLPQTPATAEPKPVP